MLNLIEARLEDIVLGAIIGRSESIDMRGILTKWRVFLQLFNVTASAAAWLVKDERRRGKSYSAVE